MIPAAHVIFVLDDSGSMRGSEDVTKLAFNGMVESLQLCKGADIVMSLIKYGTEPNLNYARTHIQEVAPLKYRPNSAHDTIYDSMLYAIRLANAAPREEKSIIILQADGGDTCSKATRRQVMGAVAEAKSKGMEFLFLANSDADYNGSFVKECGRALGFSKDEIILYSSSSSSESITAFAETAANIGSVASRLSEHAAYTPEQQDRVKKTS